MSYTIYLTTDCNFQCSYCYENYSQHIYLNKEKLVQTLDFIFRYDKSEKIMLTFMGGEPLLKKILIYQAVDYIKYHYKDRIVKYYITTNCSLIDDDFVEFMKKNAFEVRLSIDGNMKTHNLNRIPKNNKYIYESIFDNIKKVRDSGINQSVRMTITNETIPYMFENIKYFHENSLKNICLFPDINIEFTESTLSQFSKQVEKIADYYIEESMEGRKFSLDQFDGKFMNILCDFGSHFSMCDAGISNFKFMPDGKIYPCGFLTSDKKYSIGDIADHSIDVNRGKNLAISYYDKTDFRCQGCLIRNFCHGMKCGYMNLICTGSINIPSDSVCQYEHVFYPEVIRILNYLTEKKNDRINQQLNQIFLYIATEKLRLSEFGLKIQKRLELCI